MEEYISDAPLNFKLEEAIGFHVNRTAFLMSEEISSRINTLGYALSPQDFAILYHLLEKGSMTQVEIAVLMSRDKTTITRRMDALAKKSFVERNVDPHDRRCFRIAITAKGKQTMQEIIPLVRDFQQEVLSDIPDNEKEATIKTLKHMT
ncbi:MAG: MarR family transcriptional regulator, partial [Mariprofundaceae bacterium]|nr:MarR family transcriptional regulator [Mariprofundaceae bacterium]